MTPKTNNEWEKRLKEIVQEFNIQYRAEFRWRKDRINNLSAEDWIEREFTSLLSSERQRLKEEIKKIKVNEDMRIDYIQQPNFSILKGRKSYNQALSDILKLLEEIKL